MRVTRITPKWNPSLRGYLATVTVSVGGGNPERSAVRYAVKCDEPTEGEDYVIEILDPTGTVVDERTVDDTDSQFETWALQSVSQLTEAIHDQMDSRWAYRQLRGAPNREMFQ
jgi:hypothetical protein